MKFPYNKSMNKKSHKGKIVVVGGSGFVGSVLVPELERRGYQVIIVDMAEPTYETSSAVMTFDISENWQLAMTDEREMHLSHPQAYINLAGASIGQKFTDEQMKLIYDSRVKGTEQMIEFWHDDLLVPKVLVQASAVGIYGDQADNNVTEQTPRGPGFLADVATAWEGEASIAQRKFEKIRTAYFRQGHILGDGGYLGKLVPLYKKFLGGPVGKGDNYMPWIQIEDLVAYYIEAIENDSIRGVYNIVAGEPITQMEISQSLAKTLGKPSLLKIPVWVMRKKYLGLADAMISSQKIIPGRIKNFDYEPIFTDIDDAVGYSVS
jgi:uncharacterized protein (TIGR01777 family)